jgi:GNAT superfamily N-acetyltransferase
VSALFSAGAFRAIEMTAADVPALQRFFEANPGYHVAVNGEAPGSGAAQQEFDQQPPAGWPFEKRWLLKLVDGHGAMIGIVDLISNLFAAGVWHVGLFMIATSLHGGGAARALYDALEAWMRERGARWLRLGVVIGNSRAERFWEKAGYQDVRKREGVEMGKRVNALRVMAKPLGEPDWAAYLASVPRDRPESP